MKAIISHDVDHITVLEHKKDLIIPKFIIRSLIELGLGYASFSEIKDRFGECLINKWQNIEELIKFDKKHEVPSTFFVGVTDGKGLSYSLNNAVFWIKQILNEGFDVGVHGIAYKNYDLIKTEFETFKKITNKNAFGIRMHYLRHNENTLNFLSNTGYLFDSSIYEFKNPYKVDNLWEFPLHIMDSYIFYKNARWQNQKLYDAQENTKKMIEVGIKNNINYFTILYHDRHFSNSFKALKDWYIWLIEYLSTNRIELTSYREAIAELETIASR